MDYSLPGSSVHGIFQAKVLEWVAIAFYSHQISIMVLAQKEKLGLKASYIICEVVKF